MASKLTYKKLDEMVENVGLNPMDYSLYEGEDLENIADDLSIDDNMNVDEIKAFIQSMKDILKKG